MIQVEVIEQFETGMGKILTIRTKNKLHEGDLIGCGQSVYQVRSILLPTRPEQKDEIIAIIVENI